MSETRQTYTDDDGRIWHLRHDPPPIPWRGADWQAVSGDYEPGHPIAEGPTREACIADIERIVADGYECGDGEPGARAMSETKQGDGGAAIFGGGLNRGPVHFASKINQWGKVSALCYDKPRGIPWGRASWTLSDEFVTCPKCESRRSSAQQEEKP